MKNLIIILLMSLTFIGCRHYSCDEYLGIGDVWPEYGGIELSHDKICENSTAERLGLKYGDIIYFINDAEIHTVRNFEKTVSKINYGDTIRIKFKRYETGSWNSNEHGWVQKESTVIHKPIDEECDCENL